MHTFLTQICICVNNRLLLHVLDLPITNVSISAHMDAEPDTALVVQLQCLLNLPLTLHFPCASTGITGPSAIVSAFVAGQPIVRVSFLASGLMCSMSVACGALGTTGVLLDDCVTGPTHRAPIKLCALMAPFQCFCLVWTGSHTLALPSIF